ncbi:hypothetical protein PROFUN_15018 [Planoprotostelium fungivorum]|uniref:Uncharacterized protein n=1 Tax=Planoprotostelium fungivorum TaxID=1890364 RepID=A0A2P6MY58_9EUKA|nr:hypothetical protein PROFUN_15018 [Planoprotostelium fungivorum]
MNSYASAACVACGKKFKDLFVGLYTSNTSIAQVFRRLFVEKRGDGGCEPNWCNKYTTQSNEQFSVETRQARNHADRVFFEISHTAALRTSRKQVFQSRGEII